jgi:hypothetical protein
VSSLALFCSRLADKIGAKLASSHQETPIGLL